MLVEEQSVFATLVLGARLGCPVSHFRLQPAPRKLRGPVAHGCGLHSVALGLPLYITRLTRPLGDIPSKISTIETMFSLLVESELADLKFTSVENFHEAVLWGLLLISGTEGTLLSVGFPRGSCAQ